MSSKCRRL
uniref:Uncharacterized protein n=1 Tax=Arundo donax TaxID=35708 RepID=A0A0A8YQL0_ARUDO